MIQAPRRKPIVLAAVRPNEGVEAHFRRELDKLIDEMHRSVLREVKAQYRALPPEMAQDDLKFSGSPARALREIMRALGRRWNRRFNEASLELAKYFAKDMIDRSDGQLRDILKRGGFSVAFTMTADANDVLQATIGEQVALIKSIAQRYLSDVEGAVLRSAAAGRDLATLTDEIGPLVDLKRIGLGKKPGESDKSIWARTRRRAALIARDQNNKATATINRTRQSQLGIKTALWLHSHGGKEPRPTHLAQDGKPYNIETGWYDPHEGKYIWPGELINCRCVSKSIVPGFE